MIVDGCNIGLEELKKIMLEKEVKELVFKKLSPNDNSKNQPYFGGNSSLFSKFPVGEIKSEETASKKKVKTSTRFIASLNFYWVDENGKEYKAPEAKLIYYPQYPEMRFSGFLNGCNKAPSELMSHYKRGREEGRILILGIAKQNIYGFISSKNNRITKEINKLFNDSKEVFQKIPIENNKAKLLCELKRIHLKGWIQGKTLTSNGTRPCLSNPNCGGYTLEAELGIIANSDSGPDIYGWEAKQFSVKSFEKLGNKPLSLLTPEPDDGMYIKQGFREFMSNYGYPDKNGKPNRINFGGVHKVNVKCRKLTLSLMGYDYTKEIISNAKGGIALMDENSNVAALWSFDKMMNHWNKKHENTFYIPSKRKNDNGYHYSYGNNVFLFEGTNFELLLKAFVKGNVYYDPGLKIENGKIKKRNQFRAKFNDINKLYSSLETIDLNSV